MPGGLLFQTPSRLRGLYGMFTELYFASFFCCSGVKQCGQVLQPGGGCSACANAADAAASAAITASIKTRTLLVIFVCPPFRCKLADIFCPAARCKSRGGPA